MRKTILFLKYLAFLALIKIVLITILYFLIENKIIDYSIKNNAVNYIKNYSIFYKIVFIAFLGPILEEFIFRLSIIFSPVNLAITIFSGTYFITTIAMNKKLDDIDMISTRIIISLFLSLLILLISKKYHSSFSDFWNFNNKVIITISIILFSISHLLNYNLSELTFITLLIITLPRIFSGIIFTIARIKHGIVFSILLHSIINTVGIFLAFIK